MQRLIPADGYQIGQALAIFKHRNRGRSSGLEETGERPFNGDITNRAGARCCADGAEGEASGQTT